MLNYRGRNPGAGSPDGALLVERLCPAVSSPGLACPSSLSPERKRSAGFVGPQLSRSPRKVLPYRIRSPAAGGAAVVLVGARREPVTHRLSSISPATSNISSRPTRSGWGSIWTLITSRSLPTASLTVINFAGSTCGACANRGPGRPGHAQWHFWYHGPMSSIRGRACAIA
jgi:hypothetical protein